MGETAESATRAGDLYLELLKGCLTRSMFPETYRPVAFDATWKRRVFRTVMRLIGNPGGRLMVPDPYDEDVRREGRDHPPDAETMVGHLRLDNLERCVRDVVAGGVPGDLVETGVWRGGASIWMRALLEVLGDTTRRVWLADSFQGLPKPEPDRYPADEGDLFWTDPNLAVSVDQVKANFAKYGLLDDRVAFLVGWFEDTLPAAPIDRIAVLRLDGDMYSSTIQALDALYPKLSVGGYVIVDDYGCVEGCKKAVHDFRDRHGITDAIEHIDWTGAFWRRSR